jgi:hypothetical protein
LNNDFFTTGAGEDHSFASEEKIIKMILKHCGAEGIYRELLRECKEETETEGMSLSWFVNKYQSFPVWLGTRKVEWQRDVFGNLLKRFTHTPCFKAWSEVSDCKPEDYSRSVGCVFTWPQFGICCLHQYSPSIQSPDNGLWITRKLPSFEEKFIIEPLTQLVKTIDWTFPTR